MARVFLYNTRRTAMSTLSGLVSDIVFRQYHFLWLLPFVVVIIPALYVAKYLIAKQRLAHPWFEMHRLCAKLPAVSHYVKKATTLSLVLSLLILGSAEPERRIVSTENVYNVRIAFLFDSSLSMVYSSDVSPTRMAAAKTFIKSFMSRVRSDPALKGNYMFALIPFSGASIPLYTGFTAESDMFLEMLEHLDENTVTSAGTSLRAALWGYKELLNKFPVGEHDVIDFAILISDGGKEEKVGKDRDGIVKIISSLPKHVTINTIGIGSKETDAACAESVRQEARVSQKSARDVAEAIRSMCSKTVPAPLVRRGKDGAIEGYVRRNSVDSKSPVLTSELDEEMLSFIAHADGRNGEYAFFEGGDSVVEKMREVIVKNRKVINTIQRVRYEPALVLLLAPAFLVLCLLFLDGWATCMTLVKNIKSRIARVQPASD